MPSEWSKLTSLTLLNVSYNKNNDSLPVSWGKLTQIQVGWGQWGVAPVSYLSADTQALYIHHLLISKKS
jgi:hypothetical protein